MAGKIKFQTISQAAILLRDGIVVSVNDGAARFFSELVPGDLLPGNAKKFYDEGGESGSMAIAPGVGAYVKREECEEGTALVFTLHVQRPSDPLSFKAESLLREEIQKVYYNLQKLIDDGEWLHNNPRQRGYMTSLLRSVQVMTHRLNSNNFLHDLSADRLRLQTVNVQELFEQVCLSLKEVGIQHGVHMEYASAKEPVYCQVESITLQKALYYLIERAVRHTILLPKEQRAVRVSLDKLDGQARFELSNTGPVLPADYFQQHLLSSDAISYGDASDCISISAANRAFEHFGGFLMFSSQPQGTKIIAAIPVSKTPVNQLRTPAYHIDMYGGFSPLRQHLADILPDSAFDPCSSNYIEKI